jgi:hypothetical protein
MIRNCGDVWRARRSDYAGEHKNIFIAKIHDSESADSAVNYIAVVARALMARRVR